MSHCISFILAMILSFGQSYGQSIENVDFTVRDNIVYIEYNLLKSNISYRNNLKYPIYLYMHHNGERVKIEQGIYGDYLEKPSRRKKTITYNVLEDRSSLIGDVQFELQIGSGKIGSGFRDYRTAFFMIAAAFAVMIIGNSASS
jgi:hypothetical protein